jgi:pimeloyl-ACP methyl ester carboxylesterase
VPFVSAAGVEVHYVECGRPDAPHTVVILHGFPLDHRMCVNSFEPAFEAFPDWRRIYPDFPGMGRTRAPEWVASTDDVYRVTQAAVDALVSGPYALAGLSYGGYIAMGLAAAAADRVTGLALVVPVVEPSHARRDVAAQSVLVREPNVAGSEAFESMAVVVTAETVGRYMHEVEEPLAVADADAIGRIESRYGGSFPLVDRFDRPALVVLGRQDNVLGYNDQWRAAGQWPRATVAVLDRAGHGLPSEQPGLFTGLLSDWLDRVVAEPAAPRT